MNLIMLASFIYLTGLFFVYMETHPSILKLWTVHHTKDMLLSITFNNFLFWVCMLIALANISWWFLLAAFVIGGYFARDIDVMGLAPKLECRNERIYLSKEYECDSCGQFVTAIEYKERPKNN